MSAVFHEIPLVVVRVDTLPKNAPVELEMIATLNKSDYQIQCTPVGITLCDSDQKLAYHFLRYLSFDSFLSSDSVASASRIEVILSDG